MSGLERINRLDPCDSAFEEGLCQGLAGYPCGEFVARDRDNQCGKQGAAFQDWLPEMEVGYEAEPGAPPVDTDLHKAFIGERPWLYIAGYPDPGSDLQRHRDLPCSPLWQIVPVIRVDV